MPDSFYWKLTGVLFAAYALIRVTLMMTGVA